MAAVEPKAVKCNRNCSVPQCGSVAFRSRDCSFHTFPRSGQLVTVTNQHGVRVRVERRALWARVLRLGREVTKSMCVCSKHFNKSNFFLPEFKSERRRLKQTAIPSQNLPVFFPQTKGATKRLPSLLPRPSGTRGEEWCRPFMEVKVEHDFPIDIKEEPIDVSIDSPPPETIEIPVKPEFIKVEAVEHRSEVKVGEDEAEPDDFLDVGDYLELSMGASAPAVVKTEPTGSVFLCQSCTMGYSTAAFLQLHQESCRKWKRSDTGGYSSVVGGGDPGGGSKRRPEEHDDVAAARERRRPRTSRPNGPGLSSLSLRKPPQRYTRCANSSSRSEETPVILYKHC